jgi:hypothetical protein
MKKPLLEPSISNISLNNEDRLQLQQLQQSLGLKDKAINIIEAQVTTAYKQKIQQYEKAFTRNIYQQYPLSDKNRQQLQQLQESLEISDEVKNKIVAKVTEAYEQKLKQYEEKFTQAIYQQYPLSKESCDLLQQLQQKLGLSTESVVAIETRHIAPIQAERQQKLQQYEEAFARAIQRQPLSNDDREVLEPLSDNDREVLENYRQVLNLSQEITQSIEERVNQAYAQKLQQYEEAFCTAINRQYPLSNEELQPLQLLQQTLELRNEIVKSIAAKVIQAYEQKLQQYEKALIWASQRQYPFSDEDRAFLEYRRQQLNISNNIADSIAVKITEIYNQTPLEPNQLIAESREQPSNSNNIFCPSLLTESCEQPSVSNNVPCPLLLTEPEGNKQKDLRLLRLGAIVAAVLSVSAIAYYACIEQPSKANLWQATSLTARKKYKECAERAKVVPQISLAYADAQSILNKCQRLAQDEQWLTQAQDLAKQNNFKDAIALANKIPASQNFRSSAAPLIDRWSNILLKQAEARYKEAHDFQELKNAIDITTAIPKTSSVAKNAEEMRQKWQTEWHKNETHLKEAEKASMKGNWREAIARVNQIRILGQEVKQDNLYWQNNLKPIIEGAEKRVAASPNSAKPKPNLRPLRYQQPKRTVRYQQPKRTVRYQQPKRTVRYQQPKRTVRYQTPKSTVRYQTPKSTVRYQTPKSTVRYQTPKRTGWDRKTL